MDYLLLRDKFHFGFTSLQILKTALSLWNVSEFPTLWGTAEHWAKALPWEFLAALFFFFVLPLGALNKQLDECYHRVIISVINFQNYLYV